MTNDRKAMPLVSAANMYAPMRKLMTGGFIAAFLAVTPAAVQAGPVQHKFFLLNADGTADYTGTLTIDDSRLTPDTFTAFDDPAGMISLSITIAGITFTQAYSDDPQTEGVITDASGALFSFHESGSGGLTTLEPDPLIELDIADGGGAWSISFSPPLSGPAHAFERVETDVPEPSASLLLLIPLAATTVLMRRRGRSCRIGAFG